MNCVPRHELRGHGVIVLQEIQQPDLIAPMIGEDSRARRRVAIRPLAIEAATASRIRSSADAEMKTASKPNALRKNLDEYFP